MPPLLVTWAESLSTLTDRVWVNIFSGAKTGLNLIEDLFFLWSSANFGQKNGLILNGEIFFLVFIILKFPGPPLWKILCTLAPTHTGSLRLSLEPLHAF